MRVLTATPDTYRSLGEVHFTNQEPEMDNPAVSIIIPSFNRAGSLPRAIESVFTQSYRRIECIVVDDGSMDSTQQVLQSLAAKCPNNVILRTLSQPNRGANSARNLGVANSTGDLIGFLDSDDYLLPNSVEARVNPFLSDPGLDYVYGPCTVVDSSGHPIERVGQPLPQVGEAHIAKYTMHTSGPLIKRSVCQAIGRWRDDDPAALEYEYFARMKFYAARAAFIEREVAAYVRHGQQSIFDNSRLYWLSTYRMTLAIKSLVMHSRYDCDAERQELSRNFKDIAKKLSRLNDSQNAALAINESALLAPNPRNLAYLALFGTSWRYQQVKRAAYKLLSGTRQPTAGKPDMVNQPTSQR